MDPAAAPSANAPTEDQDALDPDDTWSEDVAMLHITPPSQPIHDHLNNTSSAGPISRNQSLAVSWVALSSWVKQPSPCCCAAALAGAFNACHAGRCSAEAINVSTTLKLLKELLEERMQGVRDRVARQLGAGPDILQDFERRFAQELISKCPGRSVGGKGDLCIGSKEGKRILYEFILEGKMEEEGRVAAVGGDSSGEDKEVKGLNNIYTLLSELLPPLITTAAQQPDQSLQDDEEESDSQPPLPRGGVSIDIPAFTSGKKKKSIAPKGLSSVVANGGSSSSSSQGEELLEDMVDLLIGKPSGLEKISSQRPSTAAFGTWAILQGVERLNLKATIVLQKGSTPRASGVNNQPFSGVCFVGEDDDESRRDVQWSVLSRELMRPKSCLLFHLKNHYALIYALREKAEFDHGHEEGSGGGLRRVREVLTARRGQRPSAWLSFDECRRTLLSWNQYCIIRVEKI